MANGFDLEKLIKDELQKYTKNVDKVVEDTIKKVAKQTTKDLKKASPKRTGKYAKGWTQKVENDGFTVSSVIYGKTAATWAVAHLLEHGHAKRGGGRVAPVPHIQEVQDKAVEDAIKMIREGLK